MNSFNLAVAAVKEAQATTLIHLTTFLRSGGAAAAERLEQAIRAEQRTLDEVAGHRRDYITKVIR